MERIYGIPVSDIAGAGSQRHQHEAAGRARVECSSPRCSATASSTPTCTRATSSSLSEHPENPLWIGIDCGIVGTSTGKTSATWRRTSLAFFNRDYRRVAELHVESGWVPPDTKVDEFEFAIRTVLEPIFEKPLRDLLRPRAAQSVQHRRPLQHAGAAAAGAAAKTLLYVEGLGRQLYPSWICGRPPSPIWRTGCTSRSAPRRCGMPSEKAPFWAEKLPELPELVYETLRQAAISSTTSTRCLPISSPQSPSGNRPATS